MNEIEQIDFEGMEAGKSETGVYYTDPVTSADGEQIKARVMQLDALTWVVDLFKEGVKVEGQSGKFSGRYIAVPEANKMVAVYWRMLNHARAVEMGDDIEAGNWLPLETSKPLSLWDVLPRNYKPRTTDYQGGALAWWHNPRDPWAVAREAVRRKAAIRRLYRGE